MHNSISKILYGLMAQKGLNQTDLSVATGVTQSTISRILKPNGTKGIKSPSDAQVKPLADYFGISTDQMRGHEKLPPNLLSSEDLRARLVEDLGMGHDPQLEITEIPLPIEVGRVPVLGKAMLGSDGYFDAMDYPVGHGDGFLNISSSDPDAYGLRVVGNSMTPRIKSGEFVLIEPGMKYMNGDDVLVKTSNGRAMIKEFVYLRDGQYRFDSYGPGHDPIYLDISEVVTIHFVGGIFKSYRYSPE